MGTGALLTVLHSWRMEAILLQVVGSSNLLEMVHAHAKQVMMDMLSSGFWMTEVFANA